MFLNKLHPARQWFIKDSISEMKSFSYIIQNQRVFNNTILTCIQQYNGNNVKFERAILDNTSIDLSTISER